MSERPRPCAAPPHPPVSGPASGAAPDGGRAAIRPARWFWAGWGGGSGIVRHARLSWWPLAPVAAGLVSCAGPRGLRRARVWLASLSRGQERGAVGWHLVVRRRMVGVSGPPGGVLLGPPVTVGAAVSTVAHAAQASPGGRALRGGRAGRGGARVLAPGACRQAHQAVRRPAARVGHAGVAAVGRREVKAPASGASTPTRRWRRRATADAWCRTGVSWVWPAPQHRR